MKTYQVGGCVRDRLMGSNPKDIDWVVIDETPQSMMDRGYKQVGADFPVFLNPITGDEYALARVERKNGNGYHGFDVNWSGVTIEEDLSRRDLTINAMAWNPDTKELVDPFNGQQDLNNKVIRHVNEHFMEDPVRVLRVARFAARYHDFSIASETLDLMKNMVEAGELDFLTPERVWKEVEKALSEKHFMIFFDVLNQVGAWNRISPSMMKVKFSDSPTNLLSLEEKFAFVVRTLTAIEVEVVSDQLKVPNTFRHVAVKFVTINKVLDEVVFVNQFDWVHFINQFGLMKDLKFLTSLTRLKKFSSEEVLIEKVIKFSLEISNIRFSDLTSEQQNNLKGVEIQQALNKLRRDRINQLITNG